MIKELSRENFVYGTAGNIIGMGWWLFFFTDMALHRGHEAQLSKSKISLKFKVFSVLKLRGKVSDTDGYNLTNSNDESNAVV